jgi:hypothetical protein
MTTQTKSTLNKSTLTKSTLTASQHAVLDYAHHHNEGKIIWFPDSIKGGARQKVLDSLAKRSLITRQGSDWFIASEGYEALGMPHKAPISLSILDKVIQAVIAANPQATARKGSKQELVVALLNSPEGATIAQICEATGWQPHTVRSAFAGTFKKKLGLVITSTKIDGQPRCYRIES